jgi:Protein of unknown function (DUF1565)
VRSLTALNKLLRRSLIILLPLVLMAGRAWATTYYVDDSPIGCGGSGCSNANPGTSLATAFRTIAHCETAVSAGDTCVVEVSSTPYAETVTLSTAGSSGSAITFEASTPAVVSIGDFGVAPTLAATTASTASFQVTGAYNKVIGFEITNNVQPESDNSYGILVDASNVTVTNNYIHNNCQEGLMVCNNPTGCSVTGTDVERNYFYQTEMAGAEMEGSSWVFKSNKVNATRQNPPNCGSPRSGSDADGMRFFGSTGLVQANEFYGIAVPGSTSNPNPHTDCWQTWGPASDITINGNFCHWPAIGGTNSSDYGNESANLENFQGTCAQNQNITSENNIFYNMRQGAMYQNDWDSSGGGKPCTWSGILEINNTYDYIAQSAVQLLTDSASTTNTVIRNEIFYQVGNVDSPVGGGDGPISCDAASGAGLTSDHNDFYQSGGNSGSCNNNCPITCATNADPTFVNPEGSVPSDWEMQAASTLFNSGSTISAPSTDFFGNTRPYDGNSFPALGAIEDPATTSTSTATATPSPSATPTASPTPSAAPTPVAVNLRVAPKRLKFHATGIGQSSKAKMVKVSNPKGKKGRPGSPVVVEAISTDPGVFTETNNCPPTLMPGSVCSIAVTFTPTDATKQLGMLTIKHNAKGGSQSVHLSGRGK